MEQECVAGEEAWNSVLTGDNAVARMGNNTVEVRKKIKSVAGEQSVEYGSQLRKSSPIWIQDV